MKVKCLSACCLLYFFIIAINTYSQAPAGFDKYVDSILTTFNVPGLSVSIVKDGKVVLAKGYGVKHIGTNDKVDEHTLFPIASNSKAFTALALAILAEQGRIKWDAPVISYLPWFRMSDPWITAQITVRDLLVHHSGIPAYSGDIFLFPPATYTRKQILEKLKDIPIVKSFRTTYAYDNILYAAAGEVIAEVSGMSWEDFIRINILEKVGMNETVPGYPLLSKSMNLATPHVRIQKDIVPVDDFMQQAIGEAGDPAGGISSNAADMAKWLLTELDSAKTPDQKRIIPADTYKDLWKIIRPIDVPVLPAVIKPAQPDFYGYAGGLRISNYGAYKTVGHGGKLDGAVSHVLLVPGLKLGVAVFTNQESSGAYMSIIYRVLDHYMKRPYYNWIKSYRQLLDSAMAEEKRDVEKAIIHPLASAPVPVISDQYVGKYRDAFYGDVEISRDDKGLHFSFVQTPMFKGSLVPLQYQTFTAIFNTKSLKADAYVSFTLDANGNAKGFTLKVIEPSSDISFDGLQFEKIK